MGTVRSKAAPAVGLSYLSTALSPSYGVIIGGEDISTWGMLGMLIIMIALLWWDGRAIARVLNDPVGFPLISGITAFIEIGRRAHAMGMEWSGFFGPLRPSRKR
ncbi:MAG: ABC transporter ATP-binding protein [Sphingomonas sp.]|nr:MAG: ABC transporter ATP-binding protein [Sphingomonas sp.]